jgi:hypothetical protein
MEHCACAMRDFISCSFSPSSRTFSLRVTPCNSGLSLAGAGSTVPATVTGWAGPDFQRCCGNSKDDDVLRGKRSTGCNARSQCCLLLLLTCSTAKLVGLFSP